MQSPVNRQRRFKRKASECLYIVQVTEETLAARMQVDPGTTGISDCLIFPGRVSKPVRKCQPARGTPVLFLASKYGPEETLHLPAVGELASVQLDSCTPVEKQYWGPKWAQKPGTPDKVVFSKIVDIEALARAENPVNHEARKYYNLMKWLKQQPGSSDALKSFAAGARQSTLLTPIQDITDAGDVCKGFPFWKEVFDWAATLL